MFICYEIYIKCKPSKNIVINVNKTDLFFNSFSLFSLSSLSFLCRMASMNDFIM